MKKEHPIRTLLGLKQNEMALLFGVSRSHWAMHEIGKRDLPLHATLLMSEIVTHLKPAGKIKRKTYETPAEHLQKQRAKLDWTLKQNAYAQRLVQNKITENQKKQEVRHALLSLAEYMATKKEPKDKIEALAHEFIMYKANQAIKVDNEGELLQLEIKLEMLELEKLVVDTKLRKILLRLENKGNDIKL